MSIVKRFLTFDDLLDMPEPVWLIDGMFEAKSLIMLAGPSGSFKSFLLIDWLMCMATGRAWMGKKTATCKVAYALGEGKASLVKRISAWIKYNNLSPEEFERFKVNFRVTFEVAQLGMKASTDNMLADLEKDGFKPDVIAIDTFARSFVGMDENDAKDTGLWIEGADRLRQLGYGVIFLHHTKKNTEFGVQYRGSTAIMGAMDTAMTLTRDAQTCTLSMSKQKDHDEAPNMRFRRLLLEDSCVLASAPMLDSRFTDEPQDEPKVDINVVVSQLIEDGTFDSDSARIIELSKRTGLSHDAAKKRIQRAYKETKPRTVKFEGDIYGDMQKLSPSMSPS